MYRWATLAKQLRSPLPISLTHFYRTVRWSSSSNTRYSVRAVRTRSSSVIDRNLSLTSLPPGAKILPGAPRPAASPPLHEYAGTFQSGPVRSAQRSDSFGALPACSTIIEAAGSPLACNAYGERPSRVGRDLYLHNRSTSKAASLFMIGYVTTSGARTPQVQPLGNHGACPRCTESPWHSPMEEWKNDKGWKIGRKKKEAKNGFQW